MGFLQINKGTNKFYFIHKMFYNNTKYGDFDFSGKVVKEVKKL